MLYVKNMVLINMIKYHERCLINILFYRKRRSFWCMGPFKEETVWRWGLDKVIPLGLTTLIGLSITFMLPAER